MDEELKPYINSAMIVMADDLSNALNNRLSDLDVLDRTLALAYMVGEISGEPPPQDVIDGIVAASQISREEARNLLVFSLLTAMSMLNSTLIKEG